MIRSYSVLIFRCDSLWPRPVLVFLVKARVPAFEADLLARNPHPLHVGADVEDVAISSEQSRVLARFNGAEPVGDTRESSWVECQALEGFGFGQAEGNR